MRVPFQLWPLALVLSLSACQQSSAPVAAAAVESPPSPFKLTASVQEIMQAMVDPSADAVWDSVGTTISAKGIEDRQPRTDEEWKTARLQTITLIEATNLLMMENRHIVPAGGKMADEGAQGVLTTTEAQHQLDSQHQLFVQFATALNQTGVQMLKAIDAKDTAAMMEVGTDMDEVCESCHVKFWYPNQIFPKAPEGFGSDAKPNAAAGKTQ
jgi:hypothetical protein